MLIHKNSKKSLTAVYTNMKMKVQCDTYLMMLIMYDSEMYLLSCGSFLHESLSMEDQVLAKHRLIQYIPTYIGLLSHFTIHMYSDVFSHNSLFANVYLSTSFDLKYRSL